MDSLVDVIVVVTCAEATQITRLKARLGIEEAEAHRLIAAQWPLPEKAVRADILLTTDHDLADTRYQVEALWNSL